MLRDLCVSSECSERAVRVLSREQVQSFHVQIDQKSFIGNSSNSILRALRDLRGHIPFSTRQTESNSPYCLENGLGGAKSFTINP